jgi:hypothetical protein
MLQKFLLIGVGGSGGKTLRYTWRELDRMLDAAGWTEGVPAGWQFMHIDVPEECDAVEADIPADIGDSSRYVGLARQPRQYRDYDAELASRTELLPVLARWRPDPSRSYRPPWKGAGQLRAVGRVITLNELDKVGNALNAAVAALSNDQVDAQMSRLDRKLQTDGNKRNTDPATAVVISSLGGGAGSGAFLDVIELLKARATEQAQWLDNSLLSILYAADVFSHLAPERRSGIEPNTLAALSELLNAWEHEGTVPELEDRLLDFGGGTAEVKGRRTGAQNFVIGARNESVTFGTSLDVFRAVGKALAVMISDDDVQHQFQSYISTNVAGTPARPEFLIEDQERERPCSSLGYANVSLGRSLFAQYALERLAKRSIERLLRGHLERPDASLRREEAVVAELVEEARTSFFEKSGLWELGRDHNQVIEALRKRDEISRLLDELVESVRSTLRDDKKRAPGDLFKSLGNRFDDGVRDFMAKAEASMHANAEHWVHEVQQRVLNATAEYVAMYGLSVGVALLDALSQQVIDAASELEGESAGFRNDEAESISAVDFLVRKVKEKTIGTNHSDIGTALQYRRRGLQRRFEADVCTFASELLREVSKGLLPPLRAALRSAEVSLTKAEAEQYSELVSQWSSRELPRHLRAAPNEVLLEDQLEFPDQLDGLLDAQFEGTGSQAAESAAIEELLSGAWTSRFSDREPDQQLITRRAEWLPSLSGARAASAPARQAAFSIDLTPPGVEAAARRWVADRRGPISNHVRETLAAWLSVEHIDSADRAGRFAAAFDQGLAAAAPLVSTSPDAYAAVYGGDPPAPALVISKIPIPATHPSYGPVLASLKRAGFQDADMASLFDPASQGTSVEISSFLAHSMHPVVLDSITAPIQREWQTRVNVRQRADFWDLRRARPLTSFIPLSPNKQEAAVRGWLTALLLGHVDELRAPWSERPLDIWTPRGRRRFPPNLLLGDVTKHGSVLPALLESLPLAFLTFGTGQPQELEAYMRLIELGGGGDANPEEVNPELARWLSDGAVPEADPPNESAPIPPPDLAGTAGDVGADRVTRTIMTLNSFGEAYATTVGAQRITKETSLTVGAGWEIRDLVSKSVRSLVSAIERQTAEAPPETRGVMGVPEA